MDDDLRSAIDGLIARGGRLVVRPIDATAPSVVLDQPGVRFGILEVQGRLTVDAADLGRVEGLANAGWTDPDVTRRGGREIRFRPIGPEGGPITLTRTWRVPPALASEIVAGVGSAVGEIGSMEATPLATRSARPDGAAVVSSATPDRAEIDPAFERSTGSPPAARMLGRSVPAPLRALTLVALTIAIAVGWTAIIRDTGRSSAARTGASASPSQLAGEVTSDPGTSAPEPSVAPSDAPSSTPNGIGALVTDASSQRAGSRGSSATDGDLATAWRPEAGFPQWIELHLDPVATVNAFELVITQSASGSATHVIEVAGPGDPLQVVGTVERFTTDGEHISVRPPSPIDGVERVRIETIDGPPDVGWYEVIVR